MTITQIFILTKVSKTICYTDYFFKRNYDVSVVNSGDILIIKKNDDCNFNKKFS